MRKGVYTTCGVIAWCTLCSGVASLGIESEPGHEISVDSVLTDSLPLTVTQEAHPYSQRVTAANKRGGATGISNQTLAVGERVIVECMSEYAVRIKAGRFAGLMVNTEVDVVQRGDVPHVREYVFNQSTDMIALQLKPCKSE